MSPPPLPIAPQPSKEEQMRRRMQQHMQQHMEKQSHQAMQHLLQMMGIPQSFPGQQQPQGSKHLSAREDAKKGKQRGGGRKAATGKNAKGKKRPLSAYVPFLCTNSVGCDESMDYGPLLPLYFRCL